MSIKITLDLSENNTCYCFFSGGGLSGDQWTVVVGATTAAIVFIGLMIFICCCCYCKRKKSLREKKNAKGKQSLNINSWTNIWPVCILFNVSIGVQMGFRALKWQISSHGY